MPIVSFQIAENEFLIYFPNTGTCAAGIHEFTVPFMCKIRDRRDQISFTDGSRWIKKCHTRFRIVSKIPKVIDQKSLIVI